MGLPLYPLLPLCGAYCIFYAAAAAKGKKAKDSDNQYLETGNGHGCYVH